MNILIIKTEALGDVVRTTFIAQALREKYKKQNPKIFWITQKKARPLFINNIYVDKIIMEEDKSEIKKISFDFIINLEESEELCKFTNSLKSKKIIGFIYENDNVQPTTSAKEWFNMSALGKKPQNDILKKRNKKSHRQIMSEIIGIKNYQKYEPFLRLTKEQREFTKNFLKRHNLSRTDLIIGINTGAADRWPKQLSVEKTIQLIDKIYKKYGAKILLFGGHNEIERNDKIVRLSRTPIINTGCGNDLIEFPALISICSLFITSDSLGLHLALALKRETICLVGPTSATELDMYGLGEKVIAKSKCICCYKKDCKSMEKIDLNKILKNVKKLIDKKITILITAFKEPETIGKAIEAALNQETNYNYEVIISVPDKETLDIVKEYSKKDQRLKIFKDPGKGKSFALNLIFKKIKTDILILTDGDVYISKNSVKDISNLFLNPEIGCVTGRPFPIENRKTKYGYWANFLFDAAHKIRKDSFEKSSFIECSGYLFAFRKEKIKEIPLDVAEDTVIPYMFWEKGYKIGYAENAKVYVRNTDNWKDWIAQKIRTSKAHETLHKYVDIKSTPRVKTFKKESKGVTDIIKYPKKISEIYWTFQLILARLYMWLNVFKDIKLKNNHYGDAWKRIESTK
jgi:ADP-heptose:LPS heptosyltransferase/glycosyltransferase involved in cell wall biosynthesis